MNKLIIILTSIFLSSTAYSDVIKKSNSGICHGSTSAHYERTKSFQSYNNIEDCLTSGGRLAKGAKASNKSNNNDSPSKYSRNKFGSGWADADKDCQNSRMETLISQSVGPVRYKTPKQCQVTGGKWISTFTGDVIYDASAIDIDHVVALKWAWNHGANHWPKEKRVKFANDPANLISVELRLNRQKGAKGLDEWLPPKNQCQYIVRFLRVSKKYDMEFTSAETSNYAAIKEQYCQQ